MSQAVIAKLITPSAYLVAGLLVLLPFHALLSVGVGSSFGVYDTARLWKEVLLLVLFGVVCVVLYKDTPLRKRLFVWPIFWLLLAYTVVTVGMGVVTFASHDVNSNALLYGLTVNLRFIVFFVMCVVVSARVPWLRHHWAKLLLIPAAVVVGFGLLQTFVLPNDILSHVGYGPDTIAAYQTVDQKEEYLRVQSTLRGPNSLGTYLVIVLAGAAVVLTMVKTSKMKLLAGSLLVGSLVVLSQTYSRSAYIGAAVALALTCWLLVKSPKVRRWLLVGASAVLLVGATSLVVLRQNDYIQNTFFHTDEYSQSSRSSNQDRASAMQNGFRDLTREPLGRGPGSAGPASVYNDNQVRIAENYYLQIGQEVGWVGLGLFVGIVVAIGWELLRRSPELLPVFLLASLVGISVVNLLTHAWTDDTVSLLWWGIAGIAMGPAILDTRSTISKEVV